MHQNRRVYGSGGMAGAMTDGMEGMDLGTTEARGGRDRGCDSDPAPEVGGRIEVDPGRSSL
jgi:hypothetical protein